MNRVVPEFDAVVLANGDYPTHVLASTVLEQASYVVCCDGAANEYLSRGHRPNAIVGDGDSLTDSYRTEMAEIFHPIADQETNDLTKAVRFLQEQGKHRIAILGATGQREDHTLGNISLLVEYMQQGVEVVMITDHGTFTPAAGKHTFLSHSGEQVSIFNFGATNLFSNELRYPLSDFTRWWHGTLNESTARDLTIHATGCYLLFQAFDEGR